MNTYKKFAPNVYVAQCEEKHEKGEVIPVTTRYGKENPSIVFNLVAERNGYFYYSIIREDGVNFQERAKAKAERLKSWALSAEKKSSEYHEASNEGRDFLALGEPIKVGHHSEKRHRALIERNHKRMGKSIELSDNSEEYERRAKYFEDMAEKVNLSMPESVEYYEFELEKAVNTHEGLKSGEIERGHSYSLTYAKKKRNELEKKVAMAKKLWD